MSLSTEDRLRFVQWMSDLGPDCDRTRILGLVNSQRDQAIEELLENPGMEQIRAGLLRLLPNFVADEKERAQVLADVGPILTNGTNSDDQQAPSGLSRHPAWIGLSIMEYSDLMEREDGGLDWAVEYAGQGFNFQGGHHGVGRGEILWAMAEQAEEVGWLTRTWQLLEAALQSPFAHEEHKEQVALLVALRLMEVQPERGEVVLDGILSSEHADEQTYIHASWVKAHILKERDDTMAAHACIRSALDALDETDTAQVRARLTSFLAEVKG